MENHGRSATPPLSYRHFIGLDALRGVAAIAVVFCHFASRTDLSYLFNHGYLAVDFFFALSGFVLVHAYREKIEQGRLSLAKCYTARLIRLLPLVVAGTLLAVIIESQRPGVADQAQHVKDTAVAFVMGSLLLPVWWETTLERVLFPLNLPVWSLFFEMAVNLVSAPLAYAKRAPRFAFGAIAISALVLVFAALHLGTLNLGFTVNSFWYGFARVAFSFFAGIVLYSYRSKAPKIPLSVCAIILIAILVVPTLSGALGGLFDLVAVLIVFPLLVLAAASDEPEGRAQAISKLSGDLSYPVYALHYPIVRAVGLMVRKHAMGIPGQILVVVCSTIAIVMFAGVIYRFYDVPVRKALSSLVRSRNRVLA